MAQEHGFIEDAASTLQMRNFYFNRDFRDSGAPKAKAEEWAQGFLLNAQSGYTQGIVGIGADLIGGLGVKLDSGDGRAGTLLLPNDGDGSADEFSSLGAAAKLKISKTELKVGELLPTLPILQYDDARLLPQTFQGAMLTSKEIPGLTLNAGQMRSFTQRNSSDREDMFIDGRAFATSDRYNYLGSEYRFNQDRTMLGLWGAQLEDIYHQRFIQFTHKQPLGAWTLGANIGLLDSDEDGQANAGQIDNRSFYTALSASVSGHTVMAAWQRMYGDDGTIWLSPTTTVLPSDIQVRNFASAEEKAWQLRYDYNFAAMGIPGLNAFVRYVKGDNVAVAGGNGGNGGKEWERDFDVSYVIQSGPLKNVGLRWRNAMVRSNFGPSVNDKRLIINYSLALF
ncbi:OprD family porin [Pseudomonas oryzihabitans]|uniref:OprD family porin n=1 Tax=Pseudomonas oryzihabitans TaxID=47885 RepID=UPI00123B6BA1|nr:OprD family porin [Pseudomonas oryzihabitans]QEU01796.1 OprD family porin [Pseudomonas oryzihabitans]